MAVMSLAAAAERAQAYRAQGQTVVLTIGTFDVLHRGHTRALAAARSEGDALFVIVRADRSVEAGGSLPLTPDFERAEVVAAVTAVDVVLVAEDEAAVQISEGLAPGVVVQSGEAGSAEHLVCAAIARAGGRVVLASDASAWSTSGLLSKVRRA